MGQIFNTKQAATFGLSKLYTKLQMKDSAAKYATLSSQWNDSLSVNKQTEVTAKTNALFNYKKYKKKAHDMQIRKTNLEIIFLSVSVGFLLLLLLSYVLFIRRTKHISGTYNTELEKIQQDMEIAKSNIATERKRNERLISKNKELKIEKNIAEKNTTLLQDRLIGITANNDNFLNITDLDIVEQKLMEAGIYKVIREYLASGKIVNDSIMKKVSDLLDYNIPTFRNNINSSGDISNVDYNICLLIRLHFKPSEISRLLDIDSATLSMKRKRLLKRIYNKDGSSKDFDKFVENIY